MKEILLPHSAGRLVDYSGKDDQLPLACQSDPRISDFPIPTMSFWNSPKYPIPHATVPRNNNIL